MTFWFALAQRERVGDQLVALSDRQRIACRAASHITRETRINCQMKTATKMIASGNNEDDYEKCSAILMRKKVALAANWSMPSTPSSMLIQPLKPTPANSLKMAS